MRIQHNIMAMNAYRNYTNNTSAVSKNLEKLSSGYKINRAGDDAAGLAISEKMRAQITGLDAAQKNVKDGISLVKTAEGALQEVQDMLNRMVYLATQSANGTYDNEVDRANLQKEVDQLNAEINRIADSANFNGIKLLDGSLASSTNLTSITDAADLNGWNVNRDGALAEKAQVGVFKLDLSGANWTASGGEGSISLELGGVDLLNNSTITMADKTTVTGAKVAAEIMKALDGEFTDADSNVYTVTNDSGVLTFTQKEPGKISTTALELDLNGTANVTNIHGDAEWGNQGSVQAVSLIQEPVTAGGRLYAQAEFQLQDTDITDGKALQIGDETYIFAVGKQSAFADYRGGTVIDLTDYEEGDSGIANIAAGRLSGAAESNKALYVEADLKTGTVYLTEKEGGVDYSEHNLAGKDTTTDHEDGDWKGLVRMGTVDTSTSTVGLTLQIGDTSDNFNQLTVSIDDMHTAALGIADLDISTQAGAEAAIDKIKAAINSVSMTRGTLGATQNRLEHTANNLSVMEENITDAESAIRDTDIAEEMMAYTKNNILVQSAQAMLAQANQIPQGVLQLLG